MNAACDFRLAILGGGAITELAHLPAASRLRNVRVVLLVDTNEERRQRLAEAFNIDHTSGDVQGYYDLFDAAIVALPHALHRPVSLALLARGKSVLVEKPMALTIGECETMIQVAERTGAVLAVGLVRRFIRSHKFARLLIEKGALGRIESFDFREGFVYSWPVASDFFFRKDVAGGGVLIDTGAHTLDCLLHWLGDFAEVEYFDDAEGGIEANCLMNLRLRSGASGIVELSRTRRLRNTAVICGEQGVLEIALDSNHLKLSLLGQPYAFSGDLEESSSNLDYLNLMTSQLEDFVDAIKSGRPPVVDGPSAKSSIGLIEACYRDRRHLDFLWER